MDDAVLTWQGKDQKRSNTSREGHASKELSSAQPSVFSHLDHDQCSVVRLQERKLVAHQQALECEWRFNSHMEKEDGRAACEWVAHELKIRRTMGFGWELTPGLP